MPNEFHLIVAIPDREPVSYKVSGELVKLGRSPDNDIQVLVSEVSTSHAEFHRTEDSYEITDLGSTNGTTVNGLSVKNGKATLHDRDYLILGERIPAYFVVSTEGESIDAAAVIAEIDKAQQAEETEVAETQPKLAVKKIPTLKPPAATPASPAEAGNKTIQLANPGSPPAKKLPALAKKATLSTKSPSQASGPAVKKLASPALKKTASPAPATTKLASPPLKKTASPAATKLATPGGTPAVKKIALPTKKSAGEGLKLAVPSKKVVPKLNIPKKDD